jgi:hypothetical protein
MSRKMLLARYGDGDARRMIFAAQDAASGRAGVRCSARADRGDQAPVGRDQDHVMTTQSFYRMAMETSGRPIKTHRPQAHAEATRRRMS